MIARVIDGDTVVLEGGERVRLIGMNAPEDTSKVEVFGPKATAFATDLLEGETVWLQRDVSERDRFDRLLRYIWLELPRNADSEREIREKMANAILVLEGFAQPATYRPDTRHSELFLALGKEVRAAERGLWALDPTGTTKGDSLD